VPAIVPERRLVVSSCCAPTLSEELTRPSHVIKFPCLIFAAAFILLHGAA